MNDNQPRSRILTWIAIAVASLTVLVVLLLLAGQGRSLVPYWYAGPANRPAVLRAVPGMFVIAVYLVGDRWLRQRRPHWRLPWSFAGSLAIPLALLALTGDPLYVLYTRTVSAQATGAFTVGTAMTPATLQAWPELLPGWRQYLPHLAISPPGWPLIFYGFGQALARAPGLARVLAEPLRPLQCQTWDFSLNSLADAQLGSAWLGIVSPVWAALTVFPLYWLGRRTASPAAAADAVSWWPLVPAVGVFAATLSTAYALPATVFVCLVWASANAGTAWGAAWRAGLAGLLLGVLLWLSLSLAPLLLMAGLLVLLVLRHRRGAASTGKISLAITIGLSMLAGLAAVGMVYRIAANHSPLVDFMVAMGVHLSMRRPYFASFGLHVWDFVIFAGLPAVSLALLAAVVPRRPDLTLLGLALAGTLALLLVSGSAQGEVGRVWIFFMPLVVLLAGATLQRLSARLRSVVLISQVAWLLAFGAAVTVVDTWLGAPPSYAQVAPTPLASPVVPVDARFGDDLRLAGYASQYHADTHVLTIALHWLPLRQMSTPYYFSAVPVAPGGQARQGTHWQPFAKAYPTTCWRAGSGEVVDQVDLPLGEDAAPGDWWLSLSAFAMAGDKPLAPLPVTVAGSPEDVQLGLGPLPAGGGQ